MRDGRRLCRIDEAGQAEQTRARVPAAHACHRHGRAAQAEPYVPARRCRAPDRTPQPLAGGRIRCLSSSQGSGRGAAWVSIGILERDEDESEAEALRTFGSRFDAFTLTQAAPRPDPYDELRQRMRPPASG
jgi:hypothetical protein